MLTALERWKGSQHLYNDDWVRKNQRQARQESARGNVAGHHALGRTQGWGNCNLPPSVVGERMRLYIGGARRGRQSEFPMCVSPP